MPINYYPSPSPKKFSPIYLENKLSSSIHLLSKICFSVHITIFTFALKSLDFFLTLFQKKKPHLPQRHRPPCELVPLSWNVGPRPSSGLWLLLPAIHHSVQTSGHPPFCSAPLWPDLSQPKPHRHYCNKGETTKINIRHQNMPLVSSSIDGELFLYVKNVDHHITSLHQVQT